MTATRERRTDELIHRLSREFPEHTPESLAAQVATELEAFSDAPVQDFVPIFVERRVRASIRQHA
jgi:hypothetical protein